MNLDYR